MPKRPEYEIAAENFAVLTSALGLNITAKFAPFSQSRNASESNRSLNWLCTITKNGKPIAGLGSIDYMQGIGFAPSHKSPPKFSDGRVDKWAQSAAAKVESETGKVARVMGDGRAAPSSQPIVAPTADDVLHALCLDSDVLDHASFESWAAEFGCDSDSRKGESTYRLCLAIALAMRAAIGDSELAKLRSLGNEM